MTAIRREGALSWMLLATVLVTTWHKIHWQVAGQFTLEDLFALAFLGLFVADRIRHRDGRLHQHALALAFALLCLEGVFIAGYFNLETQQALDQYAKGMAKFALHAAFLVCGAAHVLRRGRELYWRTLSALIGGMALNAAYGVLQLGCQVALGLNLDRALIGPLTFGQGGVGGINVYGQVTSGGVSNGSFGTQGVFRVNALALDPNHLGIMLDVPILILLPLCLREGLRTRRGRRLAMLLGFLAAVQVLTLSRSGYFGLAFGLAALALPYRRQLLSPRLLAAGAVTLVLLAGVASQSHYARTVFRSRFTLSDRSAQAHYAIFGLVPPVLEAHPLLGLGLNTFSVYYEFQTGRSDWGPHSFYVALIAETGLIGLTAFLLFLGWLGLRLLVLARATRLLRRRGDPLAARAGPLLHGLTAAYVATLAANAFYLTMQFYYFYALVLLIVAAPAIFAAPPLAPARRVAVSRRPVPA